MKIEFDFGKFFSSLKLKSLLYRVNIYHLISIAIIVHLFVMPFPSDGGMIFDEVHYIKAARATLQGLAANAEHPPLAKFFYAGSIAVFGDWWFAWRIVPAICSVLAIAIFYLIARKFFNEHKALLASAFLLFDSLFFVNTSIAILDAPAILFAFIGVERFLSEKWKTSALMFALAVLCKETALFVMIPVLVWYAIRKVRWHKLWGKHRVSLQKFGVFSLVFLVVTLGGLQIYDSAYHPTTGTTVQVGVQANVLEDVNHNPITTSTTTVTNTLANPIDNVVDHINFAWHYFAGLVPTINVQGGDYRPPWGWILPLENTFNPPHYLTVVTTAGSITKTALDWVSMVSPAIAFMFIPVVAVAAWLVHKRKNTELALLVLVWSLVAYVPWLVLGMFVQRMTFNYYFIYTIPALCLGIPMFWDAVTQNRKAKTVAMLIQFAVVLITFAIYFPVVLIR
jgi:dolichyl-phosphate-mannose--protein O-mannosyl transferase